ncbi:hypothetical protein O9X98_04510 [Agrobacterium salinitolerans]|nr:hypothetical protein [Agrobacterium salinitolerans]
MSDEELIDDGEMRPLGRDIREIHQKLLLVNFCVASGNGDAVTYQDLNASHDERVTFKLTLSNMVVTKIQRSIEAGGWDVPPLVEEMDVIPLASQSPRSTPASPSP